MPEKQNAQQNNILTARPPIIVVMGHIDHGKSKLLDYIRSTNVVETETGGITQHMSAYEVIHKDEKGQEKKMTFLDTPGHEAFSAMRAHGAKVADIAVLVVSAEDGVKTQTLEALKSIKEGKIPFVVAINKIDKPTANVEKTKQELAENEIYLEGYGGDIPYMEISAKQGTNVSDLLDIILLVADMEELTANASAPAEGVIIESHINPKKGISATLIITNGTLKKGCFVSSGSACAPVRSIENFLGQQIDEASFSSPVRITGFDKLALVGDTFIACDNKKSAEKCASKFKVDTKNQNIIGNKDAEIIIPVVIKTDVSGTIEAVEKEIGKIVHDKVSLKIIHKGVGDITENDVKVATGSPDAIIIGFRVKSDGEAQSTSEKFNIPIKTFGIIYNITDYLEEEVKKRIPKEEVEEKIGTAKILKTFSRMKDKQVVGGKVLSGIVSAGAQVKIIRRDTEIGEGKIIELQQQKIKATEVAEGAQFGVTIDSKMEIAEGDVIEPFNLVIK